MHQILLGKHMEEVNWILFNAEERGRPPCWRWRRARRARAQFANAQAALRSFADTFGDGVNPGELGNEPRVCEVLGGPRSARKRQFLAVLREMAERKAFILVDEILFEEGVRSPPFYTTSVGEEARYEALWHESPSDHMPLVMK